MGPGHAYGGLFCEIVEHRQAIVIAVVLRRAIRHLDEEPARVRDHQGKCMVGRDEMGVDGQSQQPQPVIEMMLPHWLVPLEQVFAAPDVIDQYVECFTLASNAGDESCNVLGDEMIDTDRHAVAAGGSDEGGGVFDGLRPAILRCLGSGGASGDVDRRARSAEFDGDPASRSAGSACDESHFSSE